MSGESQHERQKSASPDAVPLSLAEQHLDTALLAYRSRYSAEHERSTVAIMIAVCEVVDDMRPHDNGPVAMILVIKRILALHPASASIHPMAVRRSIERYYE